MSYNNNLGVLTTGQISTANDMVSTAPFKNIMGGSGGVVTAGPITVKADGMIQLGNIGGMEMKKESILFVYDLRVVDLRSTADVVDYKAPRIRLTLLEENITVDSSQDSKSRILLKHADQINKVDPSGECTVDIDFRKSWRFVSEKE